MDKERITKTTEQTLFGNISPEILASYNNPNTKYLDDESLAALEALPVPLIVYCPLKKGHKLVAVSDGFCNMLGYDRETFTRLYNENQHFLVHPNDRKVLANAEGFSAINPSEHISSVIRLKTATGKYKWVSGNADGKIGPYGHILFYATCSEMQQQQREHRNALRRNTMHVESLLQRILDTSKSATFWKDVTCRYLGANKTFLDYCGLTLEDILGKTNEEVGWLEELVVSQNSRTYKENDQLVLSGKSILRQHNQIRVHGQVREVILNKMPLMEAGKVVGIICSFDDVTNENSLQRQIQRLNSILDNISVGICLYHAHGMEYKSLATNSTLRQQLNITSDDFFLDDADNIIIQLIHPADRWQIMHSARRMANGEHNIAYNYRLRPKGSNEYKWFHLSGTYLPQADGSAFVYVTYTDITAEKIAEQELADSRKAYETAADAAGLAVWYYDILNDKKTFLDNRISQLVRNKYNLPKTIENDTDAMKQLIDPSSIAAFEKLHDDIRMGKSSSCDVQLRPTANAPIHWERLTYSVICNAEGIPAMGYGIGMDITQQKLRAMRYDQELSQLHNVSQPNLIAKSHYDLSEKKVIEYISTSVHALPVRAGDPYDSMLNILLYYITLPEDKEKVATAMNRDNLIQKFIDGERSFVLEYRRQNEYMSPILVESTISIFSGKNGHIECFFYAYDMTSKFMTDIIANKVSDLGYNQMAIINIITGTMTFYSRHTGVVESTTENPLYYNEIVQGQLIDELGPDEGEKIFDKMKLDAILNQLDEKQLYDFAFNIPGQDGAISRKRVQCFYLDKTRTSVFMAQSDITEQYNVERKRLHELHLATQEAQRANESKSLFLSSISHDMRTPLNGIISFTNFALETEDQEKQHDYLNKIKQSGSLLLNLVNDTLNLNRLESGKVKVNLETLNFAEILSTITTPIHVAADERGINFITDIDEKLPKFVRTDQLKLQEICLNILSNAVKFTKPNGTVSMSITYLKDSLLENDGHQTATCQIIIADDGIGMSEEFLPKLFDAFSQEYSSEIANPTGTGLGLSIVKRYIEMMGGNISVKSALGKGTTFCVVLPWEAVEMDVSESDSITDDQQDFSHLSALVTDDNELNVEIATMLLESRDIKVTTASNGQEAVQTFTDAQPGTFDFILMDLRMPVMNGYEAVTAIRSLEREDAKTIPIIAMSADAYEEDVKKCLACGMQAHVVKPVDPDVLFNEIAKACFH